MCFPCDPTVVLFILDIVLTPFRTTSAFTITHVSTEGPISSIGCKYILHGTLTQTAKQN